MSYVRVNRTELNVLRKKAEELKAALKTADDHRNDFKSAATNNSATWANNSAIVHKWIEYIKRTEEGNTDFGYNSDVCNNNGVKIGSEWKWKDGSVESAAKGKIAGAKVTYDNSANRVFGPGDSNDDAAFIFSALDNIVKAIEDFENITPNLEEALREKNVTLPDGFSVEDVTIVIDGEEVAVQTLVYTDEKGNKITVNEMVNAFYTYTGITVSSGLEVAYLDPDATPEKREATLRLIGTKVKEDTNSKTSKGMMSVVSDSGIAGMYEVALDETYDRNEVHNKYMLAFTDLDVEKVAEELGNDTNSNNIAAMSMAGLILTALNSTSSELSDTPLEDVNKAAIKENVKKEDDDKPEKSNDGFNTNPENGGGGAVEVIPAEAELLGTLDTEPEPVLPPDEETEVLPEDTGSESEPEPELTPEPEVSQEVARQVQDSISNTENLNPPSEMEEIKLTSDDIDNQVRDEYYSDPNLGENRVKAVDTYDSMTDAERVSSLEALGYTTVVAAGLVADKAAGQAAYVLGIDEQNMANMSNALAMQNGIVNHDTRFDDGHNLSYFESGQAGIDLASSNAEVQAARASLTNARGNYNSAVATANSAINEANESKEKYNNTLNNIKKKKGDNPQDWSKEDIDEYNKAAEEYNAAVDRANKAVADAEAQKVSYEAEKAAYDRAYEACRKQAEEGVQTVRENDQSDVIEESVPAVPDIVESVDDNGVFSTEAIPMTTPEPTEINEPVQNTPISTDEPIPTLDDMFYEE